MSMFYQHFDIRLNGFGSVIETNAIKVLNVVFPDGRYGLSEKTADYVVPEAIFLHCLRMLISERTQ